MEQGSTNKGRTGTRFGLRSAAVLVLCSLFISACSSIRPPEPKTHFAETPPPPKQEFRWSNGQMPKHLDPARAAAAPETDIVRAVYEGLTELDPETLQALPGVAEKWTSSSDLRTWTFTLREDAVWSNGKPVTAVDFVRSWMRLADYGPDSAHPQLKTNIAGMTRMRDGKLEAPGANDFTAELFRQPLASDLLIDDNTNANTAAATVPGPEPSPTPAIGKKAPVPGFSAEGPKKFVVRLLRPDKDFPRLVANPIFLPVYAGGDSLAEDRISPEIVTNGAFRVSDITPDQIVLARSDTYWARDTVSLERIVMRAGLSAEEALAEYRAGTIDAVTNAQFEPLALKLLEPYEDFRKGTFAALNFYQVNIDRYPFSDRRVRRALAIAIERERLTEGDLAGSTRPALSFLPFPTGVQAALTQDKQGARDLLEEAGFPEGAQFPVVQLLVNRNDTQQRIARSVARMWKQNLNIETEVIVKDSDEVQAAIESGDYDLARRGVVLPTADESTGIAAIFGEPEPRPTPVNGPVPMPSAAASPADLAASNSNTKSLDGPRPVADEGLTEAIAIFELECIPLYFPTSYALVKPYVLGFGMNALDAPLIRNVRIDNSWQPQPPSPES
jgi:oligopeptide transport system substrate-binding protein